MADGTVGGLEEFLERTDTYRHLTLGWKPSLEAARKYFSNSGIIRHDGFKKSDEHEILDFCNDWINSGKDRNIYLQGLQNAGKQFDRGTNSCYG